MPRPRPCKLFLDDLPIHIRPDLPAARVQTQRTQWVQAIMAPTWSHHLRFGANKFCSQAATSSFVRDYSFPFVVGPRVRIRLPPAASPFLQCTATLRAKSPELAGAAGQTANGRRQSSQPNAGSISSVTYAHDVRITYWMRLNVGALAGLAVGWFINGNSPVLPGFAGLSPLALAFVAGYAFDPFFNALDKVAATFGSLVTSQPSDTSRKSDTTYSGKAEALQHS